MLGLISFAPLYISIGRCAIRCNTSSHPRVGLVVMFEKISSIKGLLVPGVLPLVHGGGRGEGPRLIAARCRRAGPRRTARRRLRPPRQPPSGGAGTPSRSSPH